MRYFSTLSLLLLASPVFSYAVDKEIVELQRDMALLQDQVRTMQRSFDEKMAAMNVLLGQALDNINKSNTAVAVLSSTLQDRLRQQEKTVAAPVANVGAKVDQMAEEMRFVREAVNDLASRMNKLQTQLVDIDQAVKVMHAPPPPPSAGGSSLPPGVSAESLYQNAMRDKTGGNMDLALQEFTQFLQLFGSTDLASNAQFYIGEIHYLKGNFDDARQAFDLVLEKYPENNKTPDALYMKGMSLLKNKQSTAAAQEFRELVKRYPGNNLSEKGKAELKKLGLSASSSPSRAKKKK